MKADKGAGDPYQRAADGRPDAFNRAEIAAEKAPAWLALETYVEIARFAVNVV